MSVTREYPVSQTDIGVMFCGVDGEELPDELKEKLAEVLNNDVRVHRDSVWFSDTVDGSRNKGAMLRREPLSRALGDTVVRWNGGYEGAIIWTGRDF